MKGLSIVVFFFSLFLLSLLRGYEAAEVNNGVYIVYMGAAASPNSSSRNDHDQLLSSVLKRKENGLVHSYKHGFTGFAARLSAEEARSIAQKPGVVSVFSDPTFQLHTTRSWDFLKYRTDLEIDSDTGPDSDSSSSHGTDTIIGILDTGIWPESESFNDKGMGPIPSWWKGTCMEGHYDFSSSNCNRKLIGARYYNDRDAKSSKDLSPRDNDGHGTHVASTAAGSSVSGASYYGLAEGMAKGGSTGSRIAVYKVCTSGGCRGSAILAAFDDAIGDGVDLLSLSLGAEALMAPDIFEDPIAIGAFHAVEKGITVVCSAGNDGPEQYTVVNFAPWILNVAATTIDRDFESDVVLGNNKVIKGEGINFADIKKIPAYPLIYGGSAKSGSAEDSYARNCYPGSLDEDKIKGKILVCQNDDKRDPEEKLGGVKGHDVIGVILVDDESRAVASTFGADPMTVITSKEAEIILSYINSTRNPVATILPTVTVTNYKPAPAVAYFSSRGPSESARNILKPDIAAPGVDILAAWFGNDISQAPAGKEPPLFNVISGTSMACPHVSGIAATVKSRNPTWSPSAIRSAIMTTASQTNNLGAPITTDSGSIATPYDFGAGLVSTSGPLQPGLVYETDTIDYLTFLCHYGYDISIIKLISPTLPDKFECPKDSKEAHISNMNYPSIAISEFDGKESRNVSRSVTNVGAETVYIASVDAPNGIDVKVIPSTLQFTKNSKKQTYQVVFSSTTSSKLKNDVFGSITWTNGKYKVRSPFVVSSKESSSDEI